MKAHLLRCFALIVFATSIQAQESAMTDLEQKELLKSYYRGFASKIEFATADNKPLRIVDNPVLSWVGHERPGAFASGDVFVWERDGRPEVVGCIGSIPAGANQRWVFQEFHSLATGPMKEQQLEFGGLWGAKTAGIALQDVKTKLVPSKLAALRLAQMRKIAGTFTAYMRWPNNEKEERMRLMREPLYRFDTKKLAKVDSDVVDGALFAYVWSSGTDPDVLLLVECRKEQGRLVWKFGAARFTSRLLRLEHNGKEVWKVGEDHGSPTTPYRLADVGNRTYEALRLQVAAAVKEAE